MLTARKSGTIVLSHGVLTKHDGKFHGDILQQWQIWLLAMSVMAFSLLNLIVAVQLSLTLEFLLYLEY